MARGDGILPPHWEQVTLTWSRGRRRERRDLQISVFDMRAQYMSFEFNCRTRDNVEMVLEVRSSVDRRIAIGSSQPSGM